MIRWKEEWYRWQRIEPTMRRKTVALVRKLVLVKMCDVHQQGAEIH